MIEDAIGVTDVVKWAEFQHNESYRCRVVAIPEDCGGFSIFATELPGVASQGETIEEARDNIKDALIEAIRYYMSVGEDIPWGNADVQKSADSIELSVRVNV